MKVTKPVLILSARILAAAGALGAVIAALVTREFSLPVQAALGLTAAALVTSLALNPQGVKKWASGREVRYGSNSLALVLAVLGIVVVVNLVGYHNTARLDLTEDRKNSLAQETLDLLTSLESDVTAQAYFSAQLSRTSAEALLKNYQTSSKGRFRYEFIDPNQNPVQATAAGITRDGSVVLQAGNAQEIVTSVTEAELTSALLRLQSPEGKALYVLTGHGEPAFSGTEGTGYSLAAAELASKNYTVQDLNLLAGEAVPADARVLLVTGPQKPLSRAEVDRIQAYLAGGGSLLVLSQTPVLTQAAGSPDPLADYLGSEWGVRLNADMVIDTTFDPVSTVVAASYAAHPITDALKGLATVLPTARSLTVLEGAKAIALAASSDQTWSETDAAQLLSGQVGFDPASDTQGPLTLAATGEDAASGSRLVVIGDSDFGSDAYYRYYGNADLLLGSIDWLAHQDRLISLSARTGTTRTLLPPSPLVQDLVLLGTAVLLPLGVVIAAVVSFLRRRREI